MDAIHYVLVALISNVDLSHGKFSIGLIFIGSPLSGLSILLVEL